METIGILGGVGPQTTAKVYQSIINLYKKNGYERYPAILIYNLPFPFSVEHEAIVVGRNSEKMMPYLIDGTKILEKAGASFGILPCNTLHKYIDDIRKSTSIPFLSIVEESVLKLKDSGIKKVAILATQTSVNDKLFDSFLADAGIEFIYPEEGVQKDINKIIFDILNENTDGNKDKKINQICSSLKGRGAEAILLACTDLQIIMSEISCDMPVFDTTDILIEAAVRELIAKEKASI